MLHGGRCAAWWLVCCTKCTYASGWVHGFIGIVRPKMPEKNKDHECNNNTERNSNSSTDAIGASTPK